MTPHLTHRGKVLLAVAIVWEMAAAILLVSGEVAVGWPLSMVATALLLVLAVAFYAAVPISKLLESELFEVELLPPDSNESAALFTGRFVPVRARLVNHSGLGLHRLQILPELATSLKLDHGRVPMVKLRASSFADVVLPIKARRSGRWFVHGLHVSCHDVFELFRVQDYLATPMALKFLPEGLIDPRRARFLPASRLVVDRTGVHEVSQRGFGTTLREIRDHQHGDPFRNIAWKATARTGKLMVREFESEISLSTYILVDISATMRGAIELGGKLEHAIRLATNLARLTLRGNDRCGLITFDEKVYGHLPPAEGPTQQMRITQHLLGTSNVVQEEATELDEQEVLETLVRYLMLQERLDFRHRKPKRRSGQRVPEFEDLYDVGMLNRWLKKVIPEELEKYDDASLRVGIKDDEDLTLARRYCHIRGIEIPYRTELRYGTKERGMVQALKLIAAETRNPQQIVIISDLAGLVDSEMLVKVLQLVQSRRHRVAVLAPYTPRYIPKPKWEDDERGSVLHTLFSAAEARERRAILRDLHRIHVPVVEVGPEERVGTLLKRLKTMR